jgi:glycerophosphoryl diester phosphodiesterase
MNHPAPEWTLPRVFAHRCGGALAPENTLAGLPIAAALGFRGVEFDVMLSADGSPWLIHDEMLERTTNGVGKVCETTDAALQGLDAGSFHHRAFAGEQLPRFEATIARLFELDLLANVEIKPATGFEAETGEVVARAIMKLWQGAPLPLVSSFSEPALIAARKVAPQLPLGYLCERPPVDWIERMDALAAYSLHCAAWEIDDAVLASAQDKGIPVLCWTVNERSCAEALFARGVSSVFSDRIDLLRGM